MTDIAEVIERFLVVKAEVLINDGLGKEEQYSRLTLNEKALINAAVKVLLHLNLIDTVALENLERPHDENTRTS